MKTINFADQSITTEEELREIVGTPHKLVEKKSISILDEHCKAFIKMSPLLFLATADAAGKCDVSPRGDQPGTVHVLNETQLVIPDRPGNRRLDSILNILSNPHVGLVFLIPGLEEVLRINGRATIIKDKQILSEMKLKNQAPSIGIGVDVEECFIHCPRALKESNVWNRDTWENEENLPTLMEIFQAHLKINGIEMTKEATK
ncbi:MSMEG_1061 family FMN-dependent PPOX-type flavoprotein [Anaerobacillus sp. MEB173]|uniref:MSMEG_1061 family FMN-dependent PPOX-type flavoprotein n=1 Tax=Anaerobacillus sp. MEB173 TaxID=3383345 RepID=UPI003F8FFD4F